MRYLTASDVVLVNQQEIGPDLLADFGLLEAAVLRPQQSVFGSDAYPDIHSKAAAMMHSLIRNHPFVDGNKRTGVLSVIVSTTSMATSMMSRSVMNTSSSLVTGDRQP